MVYNYRIGKETNGEFVKQTPKQIRSQSSCQRWCMLYVAGTQIDWKEEVFGSQFEISNPNATSGCGCGESFGV